MYIGDEKDAQDTVDNMTSLIASPALYRTNYSVFMCSALAGSCVLLLYINLPHKLLLF